MFLFAYPGKTDAQLEDEEGTVRCTCGLEAKFAQVNKSGPNQGRQFWYVQNTRRKDLHKGHVLITLERNVDSSNGQTTNPLHLLISIQ